MSNDKCKCTLSQSMLGDGCKACQPRTYTGHLEDALQSAECEIAQLETELADAKKDQARYQHLMRGLGAIHLIYEEPKWTFRNLPKCTKSVFKGSVSQHFSKAIDAAIASIQETGK